MHNYEFIVETVCDAIVPLHLVHSGLGFQNSILHSVDCMQFIYLFILTHCGHYQFIGTSPIQCACVCVCSGMDGRLCFVLCCHWIVRWVELRAARWTIECHLCVTIIIIIINSMKYSCEWNHHPCGLQHPYGAIDTEKASDCTLPTEWPHQLLD